MICNSLDKYPSILGHAHEILTHYYQNYIWSDILCRKHIVSSYPFGKVIGNSGELSGVGGGDGVRGGRLQVTTIQHIIETEVSPAKTLKSLFSLQMVNWTILGVVWILSLLNFLWNSALRIFMQIAITTHHVSRIMV